MARTLLDTLYTLWRIQAHMKKAQWLIRSTHEKAQPKTKSMPLQKLPHPNHRITVLELIVSLCCQALIGFIPCLELVILELVAGAKLLDLLGDIDPQTYCWIQPGEIFAASLV